MKIYHYLLVVSLSLVFLLAACSGGASVSEVQPENAVPSEQSGQEAEILTEEQSSSDGMVEDTEEIKSEQNTGSDEVMEIEETVETNSMDSEMDAEKDAAEMDSGAMSAPSYFSVELIDASSGTPFRINDYKGKVVLVETLAMWCSNCFRQQTQVKALHDLLGERDDFISLGLDIDPNEVREDLKGYVESNGFDWLYAVAPAEVAREISQLYGAQFLNPPSTPMFIIDRDGEVYTLPFGIKSAEELQSALQPFLDEG